MTISTHDITLNPTSPASGPNWSVAAAGDFCIYPGLEAHDSLDARLDRLIDPSLCQWISRADLGIVNYEGVVADNAPPSPKVGASVRMDAAGPELIAKMGFELASLANNHTMDFGTPVLERNRELLDRAGLAGFGAGEDEQQAMSPVFKTIGQQRLAVLAFGEFEFGVSGPHQPGTSWISHPQALRYVQQAAAEADVVIVLAHGGVEFVPVPPYPRRQQLRAFIDAGASLVIGHHPHVPQGWEHYHDGLILYSLGNFLFRFHKQRNHAAAEWTILAGVDFQGRCPVKLRLLPVQLDPVGTLRPMSAWHDPREALSYLEELSRSVADDQTALADWRACAAWLWENRYRANLNAAVGKGLKNQLRRWIQPTLRAYRRRRYGLDDATGISIDRWQGLLLLSLMRTESHRWTIETAMSGLQESPLAADPRAGQRLARWLKWNSQ